jgi:membrane protein
MSSKHMSVEERLRMRLEQVNGEGKPAAKPEGPQGRDATRPQDIPGPGWWSIAKRTATEANNDRVMTEAAGITFYALLSLFPGLTALVSIYGLFADRATIQNHLSDLSGFLPEGGMTIINDQLQRLIESPQQALGFGAIFGVLAALWSANQGTKAMMDALNIVYDEEEKRGFVFRTLLSLGMTFGAMVFVIIAMACVIVVPVVLNFLWLGRGTETIISLARWPILLVAITTLLAVLYRYGPSREKAQWRWVSYGGIFAAVLWAIVSAGFTFYVGRFGNYDATYGSLGAVIGFMTWIWLSSIVVLVGAELNAEMEHQTARDTTTGPERQMGARGATMADTVGKS